MAGLSVSRENLRGLGLSFLVVVVAVFLYLLTPLRDMEDRMGVDFRLSLRGFNGTFDQEAKIERSHLDLLILQRVLAADCRNRELPLRQRVPRKEHRCGLH